MGHNHPISMAAGIMPEASPLELVEAAARAGFDFGGMWMAPDSWTSATTRAVAKRLRDTGLRLLDIEVVIIQPGPLDPDDLRIIEVGAELGAGNVLCVSVDPDAGAGQDKLARLIEHGAGCGIRVNLEFALFTEVKTLTQAQAFLEGISRSNAAVLIDSLHWFRSGGTLDDIAAVPSELLSYVQLCDALAAGPEIADDRSLLDEATDDRLALGRGDLPLRDIIQRLPDGLPLAIEERSKVLRETYPDLNQRAKAVARATRAFLAGTIP
ncbi:sugar phosphate isomerase/epimerase family protein [Novosphingobium colocasiae]|uniref:sugar phosphate isomerase/epimerase family protein n=1 Tax=Novosphingobium colocasiae TaxID=1256513 RepID=UPI0035AF910F